MATSSDNSVDLKHYARFLWRRKGIIILCAVSSVCAALVALAFIPKEYESDVTLLMVDRQVLIGDIERAMGGTRRVTNTRGDEQMTSLVSRVRSRPFLERVIRILRMTEDPKIIAQAEVRRDAYPGVSTDEMAVRMLVGELRSRIRFQSAGRGVYKIIVVDNSAKNSQLLARWISELFVDITIQSALKQIRIAHDFGAEQLRIYEEQLRRSETALEQYAGSLLQEELSQTVVREENFGAAESMNRRLQEEVNAARARSWPYLRALAEPKISVDPTSFSEDPRISEIVRQIAVRLETALYDWLALGTGEPGTWPPASVDALRGDLYRQLELQTASRYSEFTPEDRTNVVRYVFAQIDAETQAETADFLTRSIRDFKQRIQEQPVGELELVRLKNDVQKNRQLLESFRAQMVASDISQAVEATDLGSKIEIVDPAQIPLVPSRPNRSKILLAALLMGPLLGVGVSFLSETLDSTVRTLADVKRIVPEPILGMTPLMSRLKPRRRGIRRYWIPATLTGVVLMTVVFLLARTTVLRAVSMETTPVQLVNPDEVATP